MAFVLEVVFYVPRRGGVSRGKIRPVPSQMYCSSGAGSRTRQISKESQRIAQPARVTTWKGCRGIFLLQRRLQCRREGPECWLVPRTHDH